MIWRLSGAVIGAAVLAAATPAAAEGELNIFNWGNYTNPDLIKKFEDVYDVKVTLTDYDSNETALTKIKAGGHGFDIVVPSANYVPIFVGEGLLMESRPDQMENFKHVEARWVDVPWDPGRHYTVPWQWGTTGIAVNTSAYDGDPNTSAIFMDPPDALVGKVNVVPEMARRDRACDHVRRRRALHRGPRGAEAGARHAGRRQAELALDGLRHDREAVLGRRDGLGQLERLDVPRAARQPERGLRISEGGFPDLDGQRRGAGRCRRMSRTRSFSRTSSWSPRTRR